MGLVVDELSEELQNKWRLNGGVVISKVYPDTAAEMVGLEPGDIIVQLGYRTISSIEDYNSILEEMPSGTPVALRFFRRGRSVFRTIEIN